MREYMIKYELKKPTTVVFNANSEADAMARLEDYMSNSLDEVNVLEVKPADLYEIEYSLTSKYKLRVWAMSEEHAEEILSESYETPDGARDCSLPSIINIKKVEE